LSLDNAQVTVTAGTNALTEILIALERGGL
jgi:hypothetical protein